MPPKGSQVQGPAVRPNQLPQGSLYPGVTDFPGIPIPNSHIPHPGFPRRMEWPAGAMHYEPPVKGYSGAQYYSVSRSDLGMSDDPAPELKYYYYPELDNIFPKKPNGDPDNYNGSHVSSWLRGLAGHINPATIHLCLRASFSKNMTTLSQEIAPIQLPGANRATQQYTSWTTAADGMVKGKCNIVWVESLDNKVWEKSGIAADQRENMADALAEMNLARQQNDQARVDECQNEYNDWENELAKYEVKHKNPAQGPIGHVVCLVYVCGNVSLKIKFDYL